MRLRLRRRVRHFLLRSGVPDYAVLPDQTLLFSAPNMKKPACAANSARPTTPTAPGSPCSFFTLWRQLQLDGKRAHGNLHKGKGMCILYRMPRRRAIPPGGLLGCLSTAAVTGNPAAHLRTGEKIRANPPNSRQNERPAFSSTRSAARIMGASTILPSSTNTPLPLR